MSGPNGTPVEGSRYSPDKSQFKSKFYSSTYLHQLIIHLFSIIPILFMYIAEDAADKTYSEKGIVGKVKWFNVKAGFGFINRYVEDNQTLECDDLAEFHTLDSIFSSSRNDNGQDVYAHYSSIINKNPNHRVRSLADGELVQFNIINGSKGAEATDITGVNGVPVQGSEYARSKIRADGDAENVTDSANNTSRPPRKMNPVTSRPAPGGYNNTGSNNGGASSYRNQRPPRPSMQAPPNNMINKPIGRRPNAGDYNNPRPQNNTPGYPAFTGNNHPGNFNYNKPPSTLYN